MGAMKDRNTRKNRRTKTILPSRQTQYRNQTTPKAPGPDATHRDDFMFHDNVKKILANTTANRAGNYISSTKRIIKRIVVAAVKAAVTNTKNKLKWFIYFIITFFK